VDLLGEPQSGLALLFQSPEAVERDLVPVVVQPTARAIRIGIANFANDNAMVGLRVLSDVRICRRRET
jgi:hypothetical protein